MWSLIVLSSLLAVVSSQSTQVSQCIMQNAPLPINVYIEGCITPPRRLPQRQDTVMHVVFRAPRTITRLETQVRAYLFGVEVPYDLAEVAETCNFLTNSYCPVQQNEVWHYTLKMYIEPAFPRGARPTLKLFVRDPAVSEIIFCMMVPVQPVGRKKWNCSGNTRCQ